MLSLNRVMGKKTCVCVLLVTVVILIVLISVHFSKHSQWKRGESCYSSAAVAADAGDCSAIGR